ncbi:MAG: hypothetical protein ACK5G9_14450, partial [Akkermansiaceae bacterium]
GCADKETGSDPVHAVKGDTKHNFILSLPVAGIIMRHRVDSYLTRYLRTGKKRFFTKTPQILRFLYG